MWKEADPDHAGISLEELMKTMRTSIRRVEFGTS